MFELSQAIEVLVCVLAPVLLARAILARHAVSASTVFAGAATFVASQVVHVPLNLLVLPLLPDDASELHLPTLAVVLGLSAGLCEEVARYVALRWARPRDRSFPHALAFGAGHGGFESMLVGLLATLTLFDLLYVRRVGVEGLGLDESGDATVVAQLALLDRLGASAPLMAALERLLVIPFHVAMSCLVMRAVVEKRLRFLAFAVVAHAVLDGVAVAVVERMSPEVAEVWVAFTLPVSFAIIAVSSRRLPRSDRPRAEERPVTSGAPIELVRAEKSYGDVRALDGVSFTLAPGERACLLGPNGAGKTTSIRMITGAIAPSRGFAFLFGKTSADEAFLDAKRRVGIVPQQPGMYPELTVREYLELVRSLYGVEPNDDVARDLGLEDVMDRPTSALSGGMQRRLALAAALLPKPELLVLDEPSAGLDPVAARQMIACVKEASAGRSVLLCTHNLAEAEELCDSVVILSGGRMLLHTRIDDLRKTITARIALRIQGDVDTLIAALSHRGMRPVRDGGEVLVPVVDADAVAPGLLRDLLGEGLAISECRIVRPSLEELFFQVVGENDDTNEGASA